MGFRVLGFRGFYVGYDRAFLKVSICCILQGLGQPPVTRRVLVCNNGLKVSRQSLLSYAKIPKHYVYVVL